MKRLIFLLLFVVVYSGCDQSIAIPDKEVKGISISVVSIDQYMVTPYSTNYLSERSSIRSDYLDDLSDFQYQYTHGLITLSDYSTLSTNRTVQYNNDLSALSGRYLATKEAWGQITATLQINSTVQTYFRIEADIEYWNGATKKSESATLSSSLGTYNITVNFNAIDGARGDRGIVAIKAVK